jgi:benzoylformate decarboxylase
VVALENIVPHLKGSRIFLETLKQEGVDCIFGNPGTTELPLMDELGLDNEIKYVLGLQEAGVMAMADGYAQASGRLAVANFHAAPGLGNALGMLYNAQRSNSPLLVTAGQHDLAFTLTEPVLWGDLARIAQPFVKWSHEVGSITDLARSVHRAAKVATTAPMGPVFLSIPVNVLNDATDVPLGAPTHIGRGIRGDRQSIAQAASLLVDAKNPVLIAGDAVSQSDALNEVVALAELIGAPVYLEGAQNTATFPSGHPQFMGTLGRLAPALRSVLSKHDVLFSIGGDLFTLSLPDAVDPMPENLVVVHLDDDPWEIGKNYPTDVAILGNPKATLPELIEDIARIATPAQKARARERRSETERAVSQLRAKLRDSQPQSANASPILPRHLMQVIADALSQEVIVVEETLSSRGRIRELLKSNLRDSFFGMRGGGIGWGISAAVGIKLARRERPVVALIGDGSALYTCQSLWTAANERLGGLVFVILNNSSYRILKQRTRELGGHAAASGKYLAMDIDDPAIDYVALARTFGLSAQRVATLSDVPAALNSALRADAPYLLEIMIDRSL